MTKLYRLLLTTLVAVTASTAMAQFQYMGTFDGGGKPNYLVSPDVVTQDFVDRIANSLPEYISVPLTKPEFLANSPSDLHLLQAADVWVTYVSEGASYRNVLGYYTYPTNNPPLTAPAHSSVKIIFPNASNNGFGGGLNPGDKVFLGNFPAGTSIGWVLIADGWNGTNVDLGRWILYSTPVYNPESDPNLKRHNVQILDTLTSRLVIGFEDRRRDSADCDNDFNDLIFYLTVNPFSAVDTSGMPGSIDTAGTPGGGNNGGLESERMGDKVIKRDFNRIKQGTRRFDYASAIANSKVKDVAQRTNNANTIGYYFPNTNALVESGFSAVNVTPTDLVGLTAAVDVYSTDFIKTGKPRATVLGIETRGRAYSHTKSICDRFRGAQLLSRDSIRINGFNFVRFTLRQPDGAIEYAIAFVMSKKAGRNAFALQTNWLISEFEREDTMYNFQVWASLPHHTVLLAKDIIGRFQAVRPVQQLNTLTLPQAFVTMGQRVKDKLLVYIQNNLGNAANMELRFDYANNETDNLHQMTVPVTRNMGKYYLAEIDTKDGYEYDGALYVNGVRHDMVYLTDGGWGMDVDRTYTSILNYKVRNNPTRVYPDNEMPLYRTVDVEINSSDYITLFKFLKPGSGPMDISAYKTLKLTAKAAGVSAIEVRLIKDGITRYKDQYRYTLKVDTSSKTYKISFEDFISDSSKDFLKADDIVNVTFTAIINTGNQRRRVALQIGDISFTKEKIVSDRSLSSKDIKVMPNPTNGRFSVAVDAEADREVTLQVVGINGKVLYSKVYNLLRGNNLLNVDMGTSGFGKITAFVTLKANDAKYATKQIVLE